MSNAAVVSSPSLPTLIASTYGAASVLQFQNVLLPPACTGAYPFAAEVSLLGLALAAWLLAVGAYYSRRWSWPMCGTRTYEVVSTVGRIALMGAMVLYSGASSAAVSLLYCTSVKVATPVLSALDGGRADAPLPWVAGPCPPSASSRRTLSTCAGRAATEP